MRIDASPSDVGMDDSKFGLLRQSIERDIENGVSDASIILVARYGKIVMHEAIGYSNRRKGRVAKTDDVLPIMSLTKQLVAGAVFRFVDRGQLALTTRVAEVIPEFGKRGKERVTVRQLLSHQAGLPMQHPLEDWRHGNEAYVAKICELPLEPAPEGVANYHAGAAHAVLGEIMRRLDISKRPIHQILKEELFAPTGMADTGLSLKGRADLLSRLAPITMRDDSPDALPPRDIEQIAEICVEVDFLAGGAFSTAYDQFRLAEMLRLGGKIDGVRVLSPAIIKAATTIQSGNKFHGLFMAAAERDHTDPFPANIGLSIYVRGDGIFVTNMGTLSSPSTFAGSGFGGQLFCVDPERELTIVHLVCGYPQLYNARKRSQRLVDLIVSSIEE
ncbi:serine hydrolase domain-containing protein [Bradyrhizobium erythrophlei]|uniref:CubicO group peptidase, beta-lactamase class C family n=1 Tax=Bradyrhizobium erythrophlei TaxID=1437360 RepID=A0A1H4X042_9BRAD|nr:serine hydrolase domain-containing protein [Bradyrhizobium erythrophlei]SEC99092.1 CubicO group peptidase, beta-lactamase class C family [Bradyrhizobium erythrophlei]